MANKDLIVIGASAGGVEALKKLVQRLPADFKASLLVVQHTAPSGPGLLPSIFESVGSLPASHAADQEIIEPGHIYVAPPDHHLTVAASCRLHLTRGTKENHVSPSVDVLFRSAALARGPHVIGVVSTGWLQDGAAGLRAIKERGGIAVVQDPQDAQVPSMPESALYHVQVDHCVPLDEMADLLVRLCQEPADRTGTATSEK